MKPCFLSTSVLVGATLAAPSGYGFPVDNIIDRRPYTYWQGADTATQRITVDCGVPVSADTLAISGHNLSGSTLTVEKSTDGAAWTVINTVGPSDNLSIAIPFGSIIDGVRVNPTEISRYWALKIEGADEIPFIGVMMIGRRFSLPRFPTGSFIPESETAEIENLDSKNGLPLGSSLRYKPVKIAFSLGYPGESWTRQTFKPFYDANMGLPMFFCWDLDRWPESVIFGKLVEKYAPSFDPMGRVDKLAIAFNGTRS
jgi:hypothetical protein